MFSCQRFAVRLNHTTIGTLALVVEVFSVRSMPRQGDGSITVQTAVCTYTGLHWEREIDGRKLVNVGVIGHPANDGRTEVWYALLRQSGGEVEAEFIPVAYDHEALARQMREEGLPEPFVETILTG
jgi:hypothetical protein